MPTGTFEYRDEAERKAIEQAIAFAAELQTLAQTAPAGDVINRCEQQAVDGGRQLLRDLLQGAVQGRIDTAEVKKGRPAAVGAASRSAANDAVRGK